MRNSRQNTILRLIAAEHISTQEELQKRLQTEGFSVTQATISRDIRELHLIKKGDVNERYYCQEQTPPDLLGGNPVEADYAGNTIVLRCTSGTAQAVCTVIDSIGHPEIVGTLAGDDTIFVLVRNAELAGKTAGELTEKFQSR
ncbi:MAG: ArgR family transcriptional regulator [Oscillospiraceae bacterium]|nr:ArgR family transcriptional regulator [Oscillospiraceae bacterium]